MATDVAFERQVKVDVQLRNTIHETMARFEMHSYPSVNGLRVVLGTLLLCACVAMAEGWAAFGLAFISGVGFMLRVDCPRDLEGVTARPYFPWSEGVVATAVFINVLVSNFNGPKPLVVVTYNLGAFAVSMYMSTRTT